MLKFDAYAKLAKPPNRFQLLDTLRGLAALAVVFWHWQHFFFLKNSLPSNFDRTSQPFYYAFKIFYEHGWLAVDLFFLLSGFIFFWLYSQPIASGAMTKRAFAVLRASRLYPLHLVTLSAVIFGQIAYTTITNDSDYFVYKDNDLYHLALNLLTISSIGLEHGYSFNGPFWSVSVEIALYIIFFFFCRNILPRLNSNIKQLIALSLLVTFGFALLRPYEPLGRGVFSFFLGGIVNMAFLRAANLRSTLGPFTALMLLLAGLCWTATLLYVHLNLRQGQLPLMWRIDPRIFNLLPQLVLFPLTIFALALLDLDLPRIPSLLSRLGDISYSSYLWHFPLQLLFVTITASLGVSSQFFNTIPAMAIFFSALISLSLLSFRVIELPAQLLLRRLLISQSAQKIRGQ